MAIPPAQAPANVRNVLYTTNETGPTRPPNPVTTANAILPVPKAPQLLGTDAVQYSVTFNGSSTTGSQTVTFPALPQRDNTINPINLLQASGNSVTVLAKDSLIFKAIVQNTEAAPSAIVMVSPQPQGVDSTNLARNGPFLGSGTFKRFQAIVTVTVPGGYVGTVSGFILGEMYLSIG